MTVRHSKRDWTLSTAMDLMFSQYINKKETLVKKDQWGRPRDSGLEAALLSPSSQSSNLPG